MKNFFIKNRLLNRLKNMISNRKILNLENQKRLGKFTRTTSEYSFRSTLCHQFHLHLEKWKWVSEHQINIA